MCLGLPGQVVELLDGAQQHARVDLDGRLHEVSVAMIVDRAVEVGDWLVVHQGFAMERIDAEEARQLLRSRQELTEMYERELSGPL